MLALLCGQPPRLVHDHPEPQRVPGEALITLRVAGVCDTDLQLAQGYMGYRGVLGHEFVGEVLDADDTGWIGRRVVANINAGCGRCADCTSRQGQQGHHCDMRTVLGILGRDGALAERLVLPLRCLVEVPDAVPDDQAVFAEPLAAALHVLDDVPSDAQPIVVLGDGKLGLLIALALRAAGRDVIAVGHHAAKLHIAASVGATTLLESDLDARSLRGSVVVEATGSAAGLSRALSLLTPRGTLILKTTVAGATAVDLSPVVINELRVIGSRCGDLSRAVQHLMHTSLNLSPMIASRYPLHRAADAFTHAARRGTLKVLVHRG